MKGQCFECHGGCENHEVLEMIKCKTCGEHPSHPECFLAYKKSLNRKGLPITSAKDKRTNIKCPFCPKVGIACPCLPLVASWADGSAREWAKTRQIPEGGCARVRVHGGAGSTQ
jgi:hypothetical protein